MAPDLHYHADGQTHGRGHGSPSDDDVGNTPGWLTPQELVDPQEGRGGGAQLHEQPDHGGDVVPVLRPVHQPPGHVLQELEASNVEEADLVVDLVVEQHGGDVFRLEILFNV